MAEAMAVMSSAQFLALAFFTVCLLFWLDAALFFHMCAVAILVPALADILGIDR